MEFTLILVPETPDKYLLKPEKPLSGLAFIEEASECLRRNLDTKTQMRHTTLGAVAQYRISVPQAIAIESGYFKDASEVYIPCEENILAKYVFHAASMTRGPSNRPCYPYYQDEVALTSYVDELLFLDVWRTRGYPSKMTINLDMVNLPVLPDEDDADDALPGTMILDDVNQGAH